MSYGQSCLVSYIDENKALVGKHGFYFSQGNINSLYQALKQLVSGHQSLEQVKASGMSYVRESFKWDDVAIRHNKVYEELLEKRRHKRYGMVKANKT